MWLAPAARQPGDFALAARCSRASTFLTRSCSPPIISTGQLMRASSAFHRAHIERLKGGKFHIRSSVARARDARRTARPSLWRGCGRWLIDEVTRGRIHITAAWGEQNSEHNGQGKSADDDPGRLVPPHPNSPSHGLWNQRLGAAHVAKDRNPTLLGSSRRACQVQMSWSRPLAGRPKSPAALMTLRAAGNPSDRAERRRKGVLLGDRANEAVGGCVR